MEVFQQTSNNNSVSRTETSPLSDVFAALAIPSLKGVTQSVVASSLDLSGLVTSQSLRGIADAFLFEQELQKDFKSLSFSPRSYLRQAQDTESPALAA